MSILKFAAEDAYDRTTARNAMIGAGVLGLGASGYAGVNAINDMAKIQRSAARWERIGSWGGKAGTFAAGVGTTGLKANRAFDSLYNLDNLFGAANQGTSFSRRLWNHVAEPTIRRNPINTALAVGGSTVGTGSKLLSNYKLQRLANKTTNAKAKMILGGLGVPLSLGAIYTALGNND